jgi:mono/diheme cytochrome c family protein
MIVATAASLSALTLTFGLSLFLRSIASADPNRVTQTNAAPANVALTSEANAEAGHKLFDRNCAHCHGDDARGDEGPNLYNLKLSDARIAKRIKEGVKGEMPRFGSKLSDQEITALTAYLRSLKD